MTPIRVFTLVAGISLTVASIGFGQDYENELAPLVKTACIDCHDSSTETGLNLEALGHDLDAPETFRQWVNVFDRIERGEMPPASEERPDPKQLKSGLDWLRSNLTATNLAKRKNRGRVTARRLTKQELNYTLRDLFFIDKDVTEGIPDEVDAGTFDTVGINQRISAVHLESYLKAADLAIAEAIQLGPNPYVDYGDHADRGFSHLIEWHNKDLSQGGNITRPLENGTGVALFHDNDYLMMFSYQVHAPGKYRLSAKLSAYQRKKPVTAKFIAKGPSGNARLLKAADVAPGEPTEVVVEAFLNPGDRPYLTFRNPQPNAVYSSGGAKTFKGVGLAVHAQKIEGPMYESWPPPSTIKLLGNVVAPGGSFQDLKLTNEPKAEVRKVIERIAPRLFRRPVPAEQLEKYVALAQPALDDQRGYLEALQVSLRAMLTSPNFLVFQESPGPLDDHALANRLSYFLWKSMPDEQLFRLADEGKLTDTQVLREQVDRMLQDEKADRFIEDFVGQWLRLDHVNVTTPDDGIFPEFDELLSNSIPHETRLFFKALVSENLSLSNIIDSDFTFLNRRLAEHYKIKGVAGQEFVKFKLPDDSVRGGVLTQAAVLKTTANGTTTSPVTRGNFVLTNILGTPPSPPPPNIGSIEPDTRGQTTIREILDAHRTIATCNQCHKEIDPPGFALESFNPIGGFRKHYRISGVEMKFGGFVTKTRPSKGRPVDPSGMTSDGEAFDGIEAYRKLLMKKKGQIARNFVSQLLIYSTGAEIEFADWDHVSNILEQTKPGDYAVRDLIHAVVQSELFRSK